MVYGKLATLVGCGNCATHLWVFQRMDYVGYPAAATLGFVADNVRGARRAVAAYHRYRTGKRIFRIPISSELYRPLPPQLSTNSSGNMPPIRSRGSRSSVRYTPYRRSRVTKVKRRTIRKASRPMTRTVSTQTTVMRGRRSKRKSSSFCQKVMKCVNKANPDGHYRKIFYQKQFNDLAVNLNKIRTYQYLTPAQILDIVAVLFNGKTPVTSPDTIGNFAATNFDIPGFRGMRKTYVTNLSYLPLEMQIIQCRPKSQDAQPTLEDWQTSLNKLTGGGVSVEAPHITLNDGDGSFKKYWTVMKRKKVIIPVGARKLVLIQSTRMQDIKVEELYDGATLADYTKKMSQEVMIQPIRPNFDYGDQFNITQPRAAEQDFIIEILDDHKCSAPSVTTVTNNQDIFRYYNNLDNQTSSINNRIVMPTRQGITPAQV